jgi:hypothetical protein
MKMANELIGSARNISHTIAAVDGVIKAVPTIEAVLMVADKRWQWLGGSVGKTNALRTIRFDLTIEGAVGLRDAINDWIDDAKDEAEMIEVKEAKG